MTRAGFLMLARSGLLAGVLALFLGPMTAPPSAAPPTYSFGIVPQFEARRLAEIWEPILGELAKRTGHAFEITGSSDIPGFEKEFMEGRFDFAYMNPYHGLVAMQTQGYRPIIRDGGRRLFGVLVVKKDAPYRSVADLAGQAIAFPAPNALGAALLMRADLDRKFGLDYRASYVATHSSAYLNVYLGEAAAAGGVMATFNKTDPRLHAQLRVLYETTRVAPHPIMVHPHVPAEVAEAVQAALLDMAATEEGAALLAQVPFRQAVTAIEADYEPLRALDLESYFVSPDNVLN